MERVKQFLPTGEEITVSDEFDVVKRLVSTAARRALLPVSIHRTFDRRFLQTAIFNSSIQLHSISQTIKTVKQ